MSEEAGVRELVEVMSLVEVLRGIATQQPRPKNLTLPSARCGSSLRAARKEVADNCPDISNTFGMWQPKQLLSSMELNMVFSND